MGTNCLFGEDQKLLSKFGLLERFMLCVCVCVYLKGT